MKDDPFWADPASFSPFNHFSTEAWSRLRPDLPLGLSAFELAKLRSAGDAVSLQEVDHIYLALSRVLLAHYRGTRRLAKHRRRLLDHPRQHTPFVIAIAGSVAVGKSTTARLIKKLAEGWPRRPRVDLVTTDGFLFSTAELTRRGLMGRKGFPESYDRTRMLRFLSDVKAGKPEVAAPVYSHLRYDIDPAAKKIVDRPDVLIFEGLNVLQTPVSDGSGEPLPVASDFFDFSIFVDADPAHIESWYISRFLGLRKTAFSQPGSHFARFASLSDEDARAEAAHLWQTINAINLNENIRPTRPRADVVLRKGPEHRITDVALRRI